MTDLRQGVTETQHAVLDMLDKHAASWGANLDFDQQIAAARSRAKSAGRTSSLANKRRYAIEAAARLIDAADEIGRMISAGDK